jgi:hypothetical protein
LLNLRSAPQKRKQNAADKSAKFTHPRIAKQISRSDAKTKTTTEVKFTKFPPPARRFFILNLSNLIYYFFKI